MFRVLSGIREMLGTGNGFVLEGKYIGAEGVAKLSGNCPVEAKCFGFRWVNLKGLDFEGWVEFMVGSVYVGRIRQVHWGIRLRFGCHQ